MTLRRSLPLRLHGSAADWLPPRVACWKEPFHATHPLPSPARWPLAAAAALLTLAGSVMGSRAAAETVRRTRYPAISPDGHTICFSYLGDLWTVPTEGGRAARLTVHPARDIQPRYSPDGKWIVFASSRLWQLRPVPDAGRGRGAAAADVQQRLRLPERVHAGQPVGCLLLGRVRDRRPVQGEDQRREPVRLTWDNREWKFLPRVSPDGRWVAYDFNGSPGAWRHRGYKGSNNADIWLAHLATPIDGPARLTDNPGQDFSPLWAPESETLYYVSDREGQVNLWSMDRKGGRQRQLTHHETDGVRLPDISADGRKIVYEYDSGSGCTTRKAGRSSRPDRGGERWAREPECGAHLHRWLKRVYRLPRREEDRAADPRRAVRRDGREGRTGAPADADGRAREPHRLEPGQPRDHVRLGSVGQ